MDKILKRMEDITAELSTIKESENWDSIVLSALDENSSIKLAISGVTTKGIRKTAERIISPQAALGFVQDTFNYPPTYSVRSKDIAPETVKIAYFDNHGYLIVQHDDSTEQFKVRPENRKDVINELTIKLGNKFKTKL